MSWPDVGDVIGLPFWLSDEPYRVTGVELVAPGVVRLRGYLVRPGRVQQPVVYVVPLAMLRRLPDPTWGPSSPT